MAVSERTVGTERVELIAADKALLSLRSSGHDYCSAVGEVIDNSLQANADHVWVRVFTTKKKIGTSTKAVEVVERLAVGDDGDGMDDRTLHQALRLGFSSRYNDRKGMGRFGVGAKLGGISQAKRIEIYSRRTPGDAWLYTYIDLDEIEAKQMEVIPEPVAAQLPDDCNELVDKKGTLVVWSKTDRLEENETGGGRRAESVRSDIVPYIARTFRKFLDKGVVVEFDGKAVFAHDPLYLMTSTRYHQGEQQDPVAKIQIAESFDFPVPSDSTRTSKVYVTLTLLPKEWRQSLPGDGGSKFAQERRIDENEGFSILRAGREIFNGYLPRVQPSLDGREKDRFIGKEIRFEPELDECFHVRNVKKGAEPIEGLRDKLKEKIWQTVKSLRQQITDDAIDYKNKTLEEQGAFAEAEQIVAEAQQTARKPKAGKNTPPEVVEEKVDQAAESMVKGVPAELKAQKKKLLKERIKSQPYTVVPESWPGRELFDVQHLGSTTIVKLNMQHPFYTEVYSQLAAAGEKGEEGAAKDLARTTKLGIDLLIAAYARGEGQFDDTSVFDDLRTNWGLELRNLIQHWRKNGR